ncbi:MAG: osmoprotectant NAGGN system M42 family peptidase [Desulfobacterales bacterium]|nr:osmoprotectant NAGGN system M42 family peptidase [Desulfobacterales bacterium]
MINIEIDEDYLKKTLIALLNIHSPSGYTDQIVHFVGHELQKMEIHYNATRRGAIRATLPGRQKNCDRAILAHLDTLGAMVRKLKNNGRLLIAPIGTWPSRFAEGARVTLFTEKGPRRGTVLPMKASGHAYGDEVNKQPVDWDHLEIRVDERVTDKKDLLQAAFQVGDFVAFDALPEVTSNGFINARHLDDKAGVAALLTVAKGIVSSKVSLPVDCHLIFTIFEEVGSGASSAVYGDVAEMVVIDNAPVALLQNATEYGVTIGMMDQTGPYDYHLNRKLIELCHQYEIVVVRDVFKHYRSDSASAIEAGNDSRTALACFGVDGSHGFERTHLSSLTSIAKLVSLYIQTEPVFSRDKDEMASLNGFPHQPEREVIQIKT